MGVSLPFLLAAQQKNSVSITKRVLRIPEVTVVGKRPMKDIGVQRTRFDSIAMKENIALSMADVLTFNSSVFVKNYGRATLSTVAFRGTSPSHTQVTWNGMRINNPMLGMTDFSMIPSYFIDDASLLHGTSSVNETGGGLGGAVKLSTRPADRRGFGLQYVQGVGSFSTFDEFLRLTYGGDHWHVSTRAVYSSSPNDYKYTNHDKKINIYDDDIRLLQRRFVSPIGRGAISFYKYYLMDTLMVDKQECVHLTFVPQNPQDFGFTGHLYVVKDSTYAVKKCTMNLPKKTGVNFVENLDIVQQFEQLPDGNWVLTDDDMTVELHFVKGIQGLEVQRTTKYSDYQFTEIEPRLFRLKGNVIKEANMLAKSDEYWAKVRQVPLTKKESTMDVFMNRIEQIPGFKYVIFGAKALIENFVETGSKKHPSKFDFGPINTMITSNYVNGTRFRLSGMTTGNLDPHWSLSGYGAYGTKDKKWFYSGQVAYSFNKREYVLWEFPKHYIAFKYTYDVMSPMDKYLATDKDNLFVGWKWTTVDQMSYMRDATLTYELETNTGFSVQAMARHRNDQPAGQLQYWKNNGETPGQWDEKNTLVHDITTTELGATLRYAPGETFVNTKQRRVPVSLDAPTFTLSHTAGFKGVLGGEYNFNLTEASIRKRFWLGSWGKLDVTARAGAQWNTVPSPC